MGRIKGPQSLTRSVPAVEAKRAARVHIDIGQNQTFPGFGPLTPAAEVSANEFHFGKKLRQTLHTVGARVVVAIIAGVCHKEEVLITHTLVHRQQPVVIQGEALDIRMELDAHQPQLLDAVDFLFKVGIVDVHRSHTDKLAVRGTFAGDKAVDALHLVGSGGGGEHHRTGDPGLTLLLQQIGYRTAAAGQIGGSVHLVIVRLCVEMTGGLHGRFGDLVGENVNMSVDDFHEQTSSFGIR